MTRALSLVLVWSLWLGILPQVSAQAAPFRHELLSLLPDDFAVCAAMHDLRGQANRWERSDWFKAFRLSPPGRALFEAPELKLVSQWENELKKYFEIDWPALRDDILGDTVVLAYSPGSSNKSEEERGIVLLHAHKPERLTALIQRLNDLQKKSEELKSLDAVSYKGATYYHRVQGTKHQYYFHEGPLLAFSSQEDLIQGVLDRRMADARENVWTRRFRKAGAERGFLTLFINPRMSEPDFVKNSKAGDPFPAYWRALEGIFLSLSIEDNAQLRITIQADTAALPKWARSTFTKTTTPSALWHRFPEASIATIASQLDFAGAVEGMQMFLPEKERQNIATQLHRTVGAFLGQDVFKDILPNIGPDWGVCVLPSRDPRHLPMLLVAVAVKPGAKDPPVDQSLLKAVNLFAGFVLFEYNRNHPDELRLQTVKQDKVEILYLSNDKLFPPGVQPACALKDGYLLFASSPAAIAEFGKQDAKVEAHGDAPLFRLSTHLLAAQLRLGREHIVSNLIARHKMPETEARKNLDSVIALLELFERVTLSQQASTGQATWTLRINAQ